MNKTIEEIMARFTMKDGAFLSTWNEKTGAYTVSFEGDGLLKELTSLLKQQEQEAVRKYNKYIRNQYFEDYDIEIYLKQEEDK